MQTLGMYRILPLLGLCVLNICISVTLGQAACDPATEFRCTMDLPGSLPRCIQLQQVNNSVNDCLDNSDEVWRPCQKKDGFSCKNNRCVIMAWVLDGTDDCHDGSDEAKIVGTSCGMINTCCECDQYVAWTECRNATCQCVSGFYNNSLGTVCHRRIIGDWCDVNADCHDAFNNSHCENGFCVCDIGYYTSDDNASCVANRVGDVCEVDGNCTAVIHQSNCTNAQCMCNSGYYQSSDRTTCIKRRLGDDCSFQHDCVSVMAHSQCNATSSNNISNSTTSTSTSTSSTITTTSNTTSTCICELGYHPHNKATSCRRKLLDDPCRSDADCTFAMHGSSCGKINATCECNNGYMELKHLAGCKARTLGDSCRRDLDCTPVIKNGVCDFDQCSCDFGYFQDLEKQVCYDNLIGERTIVVVFSVFLIALLVLLITFLLGLICVTYVL